MNTKPQTAAFSAHLNLYAGGLSALCLVHCLAVPILVTLLPVLGQAIDNPLLHQSLVLLAAPATLWLVAKSLSTSGNGPFVLMALAGLGLLLLAAFVEALAAREELITVAGATLLGFAHFRRWAQHRRLVCEHQAACGLPGTERQPPRN